MKNYDTYGLREDGAGSGDRNDFKAFVLLNRLRLLEEVSKYGFMCDWNDFKVCCWFFGTRESVTLAVVSRSPEQNPTTSAVAHSRPGCFKRDSKVCCCIGTRVYVTALKVLPTTPNTMSRHPGYSSC